MKSHALLLFSLLGSLHAQGQWRDLFNGKDLKNWQVAIAGQEPGKDPDQLVQVRDGNIHMYADTDENANVPFGVIVHEEEFSHYHLSLEYRWTGKKFAPRKEAIRDAGLLYHSTETNMVWPESVEYQIQEGDTGDIVFIRTGGFTWMHPNPEKAPEGQGKPGLLPEHGGYLMPRVTNTWDYIGRFPVLDRNEGWNQVEILVRGADYAEHMVNGKTKARLFDLQNQDGSPRSKGKISLQLEGAEIEYRNIRIRPLPESLRISHRHIAMSAVKGIKSPIASLRVAFPAKSASAFSIIGADAAAFRMASSSKNANGETEFQIEFSPNRGAGRYSAGIQLGDPANDHAFVILQGLSLAALEGKNEPTLEEITRALGIPLNVGGSELSLDTKQPTIGDSVEAPYFQAASSNKIRITPLARFSPPGVTPIGISHRGEASLIEVARLADSSKIGDAHQRLFASFENGESVEIEAPEKPFTIYMKGHQYTSFTDSARDGGAKIPNTARVYPVRHFQGQKRANSFLVAFEEAANGDYQDAVLLVENVKIAE